MLIILIIVLTYITLATVATLLDLLASTHKLSAAADSFIDDFVHAVFFDFRHFF